MSATLSALDPESWQHATHCAVARGNAGPSLADMGIGTVNIVDTSNQ